MEKRKCGSSAINLKRKTSTETGKRKEQNE
jgi:hypothetical protein